MTDQNDPASLARRFIDLWQDQLETVSRDTELNAATQRWLRYWMNAGAATRPMAASPPDPGTSADDAGPEANAAADGERGRPLGSEAAGAPSRDRDTDLDELARRV
ncbi:MAG: hypothetical protein P8N43_10845 [Alphaproteobacteria bacterium]|nr:hypothetical protein [Alphaproteobacteria bacterium]